MKKLLLIKKLLLCTLCLSLIMDFPVKIKAETTATGSTTTTWPSLPLLVGTNSSSHTGGSSGGSVSPAAPATSGKITSIKAKFNNKSKMDMEENVLVGTSIVPSDFEITANYEKGSKVLSADEISSVTVSAVNIPLNANGKFKVILSYNDTNNTKTGKALTADDKIKTTNERLDSIDARWQGSKSYHIGDEINNADIIVNALYTFIEANGNQKKTNKSLRPKDFTLEPEVIKLNGPNLIKVKYRDKETTVIITGYGMKGLEIEYKGGDTIVVGQSIDRNKIVARLVYNDGEQKKISSKDLIVKDQAIHVGENIIQAEYDGQIGTFKITGIAKTPEKITAKYSGKEQVVGTAVDLSKISVTVFYNDKTKEVINTGFTVSPDKVTQIGINTITVIYKSLSDTINIKGTELLPVNITAVYNGRGVIEGNALEHASITVTAFYPDGKSKTVTDFDLSMKTMNKVGMQEVLVKYKNLTAKIYVPVTAKRVVELSATYNGATLQQHDSLDRKKIVVIATYNDGSTGNVTDFMISSTTATKIGENVFIINYGGKMTKLVLNAVGRVVAGMGSLTAKVGDGDNKVTLTAHIQDQFVREVMELKIESVDSDDIRRGVKRVGSTDNYIAFNMDVDNFQFDQNKYMMAEIEVPKSFDPAKTAVYYTPDGKIMVQQTGGLVSKKLYRFYAYSSGTYIVMENNNNLVNKQELREQDTIAPFMVVLCNKIIKVGKDSKIFPYILFGDKSKEDDFKYEVDNQDILTVSLKGEVKTKSEGTAKVNITSKTMGFSETVEITVVGKDYKEEDEDYDDADDED